MKMQLAVALLLSTSVFIPQQRGWVSSVSAPADANAPGTIQFLVRGSNPCGAVNIDYGDGSDSVTHAIREVPVTIPHEYTRTGNFVVRAKGMGNCDGDVTTRVTVSRVAIRRQDTPAPRQPFPGINPRWLAVWTDDQFRQVDRNGDTFISRAEWPGDLAEFQRVDRNNDDRLSRSEFLDGDNRDRDKTGNDKGDKDKDKADKGHKGGRGNRDESVTLAVSARRTWTDTGLDVRVGDELIIEAKGRIQFSANSGDTAGPSGAPGNRGAANAPLPRTALGALIARVGNSAPFDATTKGKRLQEPESGRLYLGINDGYVNDNSGEFRVTVSIKDGKK